MAITSVGICSKNLNKILNVSKCLYSSYKSSLFYEDVQDCKPPKYEAIEPSLYWKYVQQALPPATVPEPKIKENYPSDWKPQQAEYTNSKYFISRTKNHMIPVYLNLKYNGMKRITIVKFIKGDIWALEKDLREFLSAENKHVRSQVNEFAGYIRFHGDHVNALKYWIQKHNL